MHMDDDDDDDDIAVGGVCKKPPCPMDWSDGAVAHEALLREQRTLPV